MKLNPELLAQALKSVDTSAWKHYEMEYGSRSIMFDAPPDYTELSMGRVAPVADVKSAVAQALSNPMGSPPIGKIVAAKGKDPAMMTAAITVSDITRPVNYNGGDGILMPRLRPWNPPDSSAGTSES